MVRATLKRCAAATGTFHEWGGFVLFKFFGSTFDCGGGGLS